MAVYRVSLCFNQNQSGWTENFYWESSGFPSMQDTLWKNLQKQAIAPRAPGTVLYAIRLSDIANPRTGIIFYTQNVFKPLNALAVGNVSDVVSTTAQIQLRTGLGSTRTLGLRGLMDRDTSRDTEGVDQLNAAFSKSIANYVEAIADLTFTIRYKRGDGVGGITRTPVTSISRNLVNPGWTDVAVVNGAAAGLAVGGPILFYGSPRKDLLGFPTQTKILQMANANTATIAYSMQFTPYGPVNVHCRNPNFAFLPVERVFKFIRFSEHKTGRPFGSLRGRARQVTRRR